MDGKSGLGRFAGNLPCFPYQSGPMHLLLWFAIVATATGTNILKVTIDEKTGSFSINVAGRWDMVSDEYFFRADGNTFSTSNKTLTFAGSVDYSGADNLGPYTRHELQWKAGANHIITRITEYTNTNAVSFEQFFPTGLSRTAVSSKDALNMLTTAFPSFKTTTQPSIQRGIIAWGDPWAWQPHGGVWGSGSIPSNAQQCGPVAIFDKGAAVVLSSLTQPMAHNRNWHNGVLSYGLLGTIVDVPSEYSISFLMVGHSYTTPTPQVTQSMLNWGDATLKYHGKKERNPHDRDFTLKWLGYSTDNGAYYYYHTEEGKNYQDTIIDIHAYSMKEKLPYKYILLDSWWYFKGNGDGVKQWAARPDIFPGNITAVFNATGWRIQAHNRYWASDTVYAEQNGGAFPFDMSPTDKNVCAPTSQYFWDWLLHQGLEWGLTVYEQDWLWNEFQDVAQLQESPTLGGLWLTQMANAAERAGLTIQYCMSWARHVLTAAEFPAVTNARASNDYMHEHDKNWMLGGSGVFSWAVGVAPSKDNYWSTTNQPGNNWKQKEPYPAIQSAVSSLSAGPVAPGDKIGYSNRSLIMRCCRDDGMLLRPDRPALAHDQQLLALATGNKQGWNGQIWTTYTHIGGYQWWHVFAADVAQDTEFTLDDVYPWLVPKTGNLFWYPNGANVAENFTMIQPLKIKKCGEGDFQLYHIGNMMENGYYLLGEMDKWIRVSQQRFSEIEIQPQGFSARIDGAVGEKVTIAYGSESGGPYMTTKTVTIPSEGYTTAYFS